MSTIYSATILGKKNKGGSGTFSVEFEADDNFKVGDIKKVNQLALVLCMNQNPSKFKTYDTYEVKGVSKVRKVKEKGSEENISSSSNNSENNISSKKKKSIFRKPYFLIPFRLLFTILLIPFRILFFILGSKKLGNYFKNLMID